MLVRDHSLKLSHCCKQRTTFFFFNLKSSFLCLMSKCRAILVIMLYKVEIVIFFSNVNLPLRRLQSKLALLVLTLASPFL